MTSKDQKDLEQVRKFGIPIETLCAEFERLENLEDKTDELKMELEEKQKEIEERDKYNITTLPFEKIRADIEQNKNIFIFGKEYISKDKIMEKLDYQYMLWNTPNRQKEYNQEVVDILQELLEEK